MEFQAIFPTADDVVRLQPEELGKRMLPVLRNWPEGHMFAIGELLERVAGDRSNAFALASYPADRRQEVRDALEDAWRGLEREGAIEPNTAGPSPSRLSRRASDYAAELAKSLENPSLLTTAAAPQEKQGELITLKPTLWGLSIDLKELWRRIRCWWKCRWKNRQ